MASGSESWSTITTGVGSVPVSWELSPCLVHSNNQREYMLKTVLYITQTEFDTSIAVVGDTFGIFRLVKNEDLMHRKWVWLSQNENQVKALLTIQLNESNAFGILRHVDNDDLMHGK